MADRRDATEAIRRLDGADLDDRGAAGPARLDWWMRTAPVSGARDLHQALLAHATDLTVIGTALRPVDGLSQADSTVTLHTAVTSHTVWFHRPFVPQDWHRYEVTKLNNSDSRGLVRGALYDTGGVLIASTSQEALWRL